MTDGCSFDIIRQGQELFGFKQSGKEESLVNLINGNDSWLKALAIYNSRNLESDVIIVSIRKQLNDIDSVVRETAEYILKNR